jgi:hypothetical protein
VGLYSTSCFSIGYTSTNIFSADETAFFYSLMPNKSLHMKGKTCHGGIRRKQHLTVLLFSSVDGSGQAEEALGGWIICKAWSFKNISTSPCKYTHNNNPLMTKISANLMPQWVLLINRCCCS